MISKLLNAIINTSEIIGCSILITLIIVGWISYCVDKNYHPIIGMSIPLLFVWAYMVYHTYSIN